MYILHIETSTTMCSVALSKDNDCIFSVSNNEGMNHAALLSLFIKEALDKLDGLHQKLNAIAVSSGPGSYTGLRIGVSTAKGLCYGYDIPLIAVSTLETMTLAALETTTETEKILFCPMIDARRMEVYSAFYTADLTLFRQISADIIDFESYRAILDEYTVYFFGNGSDKCKTTLTHPNARFINDVHPTAEKMISLALKAYQKNEFVDVAYYEPFYLKEFQATIPKKIL